MQGVSHECHKNVVKDWSQIQKQSRNIRPSGRVPSLQPKCRLNKDLHACKKHQLLRVRVSRYALVYFSAILFVQYLCLGLLDSAVKFLIVSRTGTATTILNERATRGKPWYSCHKVKLKSNINRTYSFFLFIFLKDRSLKAWHKLN